MQQTRKISVYTLQNKTQRHRRTKQTNEWQQLIQHARYNKHNNLTIQRVHDIFYNLKNAFCQSFHNDQTHDENTIQGLSLKLIKIFIQKASKILPI